MNIATATDVRPAEGPANLYDLVSHTLRPDWGVAVMAWESADKRGYQFEDGLVRVFKRGYYHLLQPAELPAGRDDHVIHSLRKQAALARTRQYALSDGASVDKDAPSLDTQMEWLLAQFPGGFQDPAWLSGLRGDGAARRLKVHRDSAIADAKRLLGGDDLIGLLGAGEHAEILRRTVEVLGGTDLVSPRQFRALKTLAGPARTTFAEALVALLHGEGRGEDRISTCVRALGPKEASWPLLTAPLGLLYPDTDICVRLTSFRTQAKWMALGLSADPQPDGVRYRGWLEMARRVRDRLLGSGQSPRDLMDVYDFIRLTVK